MELLTVGIISAIVGAVIGIFIYRNNVKDIAPVADKVDDKWDEKVAPVLEKIESEIKEIKEKIK